jgi:hypothetical protein
MSKIFDEMWKRVEDGETVERIWPTLKRSQRDELARDNLHAIEQAVKRHKQLKIEREAVIVEPKTQPAKIITNNDQPSFEECYDDPLLMHRKGGSYPTYCRFPDRKRFMKWADKNRANQGGFKAWLVRARTTLRKNLTDFDRDMFESQWHPEGATAYFNNRHCQKLMGLVSETVNFVKEQTRLEVTRELLNSEFALGDGRRVTWGEATIEEHEQRAALLRNNSVANIEAEARHRQAIDMILKARVRCLSEIDDG